MTVIRLSIKPVFPNHDPGHPPTLHVFYVSLIQRFSIPVLAPPRSAYFVCYSYRFRCLFYSNVSALRSGHHRIFLHDSSSKRTYIFHSKCIEVCKTWIKIVYIYRGIWCHTRPGENTSPSVTSTPRSVQSLNVALTLALGHKSMSQPV